MENYPLSKLKRLAKDRGIKGYSTYTSANKRQLINRIKKAPPLSVVRRGQRISKIECIPLKELKRIAKSEGIIGYSTYTSANKRDLYFKIKKAQKRPGKTCVPKFRHGAIPCPKSNLDHVGISALKRKAMKCCIRGYNKMSAPKLRKAIYNAQVKAWEKQHGKKWTPKGKSIGRVI